MGQKEIIDFLKSKRRYYSARELAENLGQTSTAISHSLVRLRKYRMIRTRFEKRRCTDNSIREMKVYKL